MKPITVFGTWLVTLLAGLLIGVVVFQDVFMALVFSAVAAVCSLPYLAIMIAVCFAIKDFWQQQIVHVLLTVIIIVGLIAMDEKFIENLTWAPAAYFLVGGLIQYGFWKRKSPKLDDGNQPG